MRVWSAGNLGLPRNFWLIYARVRSSATKISEKGSYFLTNIIINVYFTFNNYLCQFSMHYPGAVGHEVTFIELLNVK